MTKNNIKYDKKDAAKILTFLKSRSGSRLKANSCKIQQQNNWQFRVTIPKAIGSAYNLINGSVVNWEITQRGLLLKRGGEKHDINKQWIWSNNQRDIFWYIKTSFKENERDWADK